MAEVHCLYGEETHEDVAYDVQAAQHRSDGEHPVTLIDTALIPGGGQLLLLKCGDDFSIQYNAEELMGSVDHVSEQALAVLTCARLPNADGRVLIGGLGMGFTLGAALGAWSSRASIVVAELVPQIVAWAKGPLAHLFGGSLSDPRVTIEVADVHDVIAAQSDHFDAILLDVDNGPDGLIQLENERLYSNWGLRTAFGALRAGGILAVWSAYPSQGFAAKLEAAGFVVEETPVPAYSGSEDHWHTVWFAAKPR